MRNKTALKILERHRGKLDDPNYDSYYVWHQQAISYVKNFLGEDSKEYELLNKITFPDYAKTTPEGYKKDLQLLRHVLITNGNQIIETVRNLGIKRIYHNFLCRFTDKELIAGIVIAASAILGAGIFIGKLIYQYKITNP
ncbi:MAG TPA: hypothetical protein VFN30_04515 [Chitinophagaceae bacterium]|nr:hypothetical protein [Chitinophagaceae bacterium]